MKTLIFTFAVLTLIVFSCYYDSEESLYPGENLGNCDTTNVTYKGSIVSLLENNCLSCHAGSVSNDKGGGIALDDYNRIFEIREIILSSISHDGSSQEMPKNSAKLKDCLIRQFEIWVADGANKN